MRKFLISAAVAASVLAIAAPASAQLYGGYGYNNYGYNSYGDNGYGYGYGRDRVGYESDRLVSINMQRIARIHSEIRQLVQTGMISPGEASRLDRTAEQFRQEIQWAARGGMDGREGAMLDARLDRFETPIRARLGYGDYSYGRYGRYQYDREDR